MCSREPAVKSKGFTAGFPYYEWQRKDGNIGWGADIAGNRWIPGQVSGLVFKVSSYRVCVAADFYFIAGGAELRFNAVFFLFPLEPL